MKTEEKREYLKNQTHEQLEIFVLNGDTEREYLEERLFLLSGCKDYGNHDSMNGSCIDCYHNNKDLFERCRAFENMISAHRKNNND